MTELDSIASDLRRIYEGSAWHGPSVLEALRDVTAEQAGRRLTPQTHTIFELTHHIAAWMGEAASRLRGSAPGEPADGDWLSALPSVSVAQWRQVQELLATRQFELVTRVLELAPRRLDDLVDPSGQRPADRNYTMREMLHGVTQHNAYHAGQIMLLRRAMGR